MELNEDNYDDLLAGPTVCFVEPEDDGTLSIYTPADEEYAGCVDDTNAVKRIVRAFTTKPDGKYFGYVDVFTNSDKTTSKLTYLTDRVMIVDWTKTEKDGVKLDLSKIKVSDLLVNDVAEGDEVIVYNAYYKIPGGYGDVSTGDQRVSLIIITKHA